LALLKRLYEGIMVKINCKLVPMTESLINTEYLETLNDKHYMKYSRQSLINHSLESSRTFIHETSVNPQKDFFAFLNESEIFSGTCIIDSDLKNKVANLGFLILRRYSGKGYGSKMFQLMVQELLKRSEVEFVEIGTNPNNLGMLAIAKKAQMPLVNTSENLFGEQKYILYRDSVVNIRKNMLIN